MADNEQKAEQLVAEAEKKLNAKPFLGKTKQSSYREIIPGGHK
jgi:hypothetical protein